MTNDDKLNILNYIVGNITPTSKNNNEIFLEQEEISRSEWENFLPSGWNSFNYEGMVAGNEKTSSLSVLYGGYIDTNGNTHGIITLVDENFKPIKTIYKYDSGTDLRYIQYMKQAEDGTFYFIDDSSFPFKNGANVKSSQKRFCMTNNFTIPNKATNDYEVKLRTSYIFGDSFKNFYCKNMYKDPLVSHYVFFGQVADGDNYLRTLKIFGLKINVGSANDWTLYYEDGMMLFGSAIATFENETGTSNVRFRCLASPVNVSNRYIVCISKNYTGGVSVSNVKNFQFKPYIDDYHMKKQSVFLNYDEVYFVQNNQHWGVSGTLERKSIGLYKYDFSDNTNIIIYEKNLGNYDYCNIESIYIDKCNTDIYIQYNTNIDAVNYKADYYFQRLINDRWSPYLVAEQEDFVYDQRSIFIKSNFNLLQANLYAINPRTQTWFNYGIKEDYNTANYNSDSYTDYDSIINRKGRVYSDSKLVFARNLYNRYYYNNTTTSILQIPNNYLNGINIDTKQLLSNTNLITHQDTTILNKNIYEMLFLNFVDTLYVLDEDTDTYYNDIANYVNSNVNTGTETNYDNTRLGKVRINYTTPSIQEITWNWNVDHYETSFTIYTTEIPTSIDFISNDENTIYLSKRIGNLQTNKYYTISQKLRIE